jgi:IclR family acetate operon transcriptional repressor
MTPDVVERAVPLLRQAAEDLADVLNVNHSPGADRVAG